MGQADQAAQGPTAPNAYDGMNQGAQGMAQGFNGATQAGTSMQGMQRAQDPMGMDGSPLAAIIKAILAAVAQSQSPGMAPPGGAPQQPGGNSLGGPPQMMSPGPQSAAPMRQPPGR